MMIRDELLPDVKKSRLAISGRYIPVLGTVGLEPLVYCFPSSYAFKDKGLLEH